jgi:hypothetical protein
MPMPARFTFTRLEQQAVPRSEASVMAAADADALSQRDFVRSVVDRWRGATKGDTGAPPRDGMSDEPDRSGIGVSRLLDDARMQILKR